MKGKRLIAVFLTLMLMISVMMPSVSAREFSRSGNTASSWDATQTNDSYSDDSNEEVDASTETPAAEDETPAAEDETPAAEDENPGSKEENPAEGSDPESDPSEEMPPSEEETNDENMPDSSENDDLPPLAEDGIELYASNFTAYLVDENGGSVGNKTTPINGNQYTDWTSVSDVAPTIDGYDFVRAYTSSYGGKETTVTYIHYQQGYFGDSWWYTSDSDPWDSSRLNNLYFVYKANDGKVALTFNTNGGSGSVDSIRAEADTTVTLPDYDGTRNGYTFIGWTTAAVTFPNTTYYAVYEADSQFTLDSNTTLYAAWESNSASTTAYFYIRLDGEIPYEPGSYEVADYTNGIQMTDAITVQNWVVDVDTTKEIVDNGNCVANDVTAVLNKLPSDDLIQRVYPDYDPETQYILWYVQKYQSLGSSAINEAGNTISTSGDGWHIDGVLLTRDKVLISYDANVPTGVTTTPDVPQGYQVTSGTTVTVGESGGVDGSMDRANPSIAGYTFMGWNTKADGTGIPYENYDEIILTENVTLYAQWSKTGNTLRLTKVDGLGYNLAGASFTISSGTSNSTFTAGTYTNSRIYTDTVYTITETAAPEGYKIVTASFSFIISSQGGTALTAYLCDAEGDELSQNPEGVELSYRNGTVNITVTNIGYFYVYHSSDQSVETFEINKTNLPNDTFDITAKVKDGYLYGGYYSDYLKKGNYTGGATVTEDGISYTGAIAGYWDSGDAYTANGTTMTPVAGTTYYLKEVPESYFQPAMAVVYDTYTNPWAVKKLYLISATDDKNYKDFGLAVVNKDGYEQVKEYSLTFTFQRQVNGSTETLTAYSLFGVPTGYLGVWNATDELTVDNDFTYTPYVVTPDGVTVYGTKTRTVYTGDVTYRGSLDTTIDGASNPGVHKKVDEAAEI